MRTSTGEGRFPRADRRAASTFGVHEPCLAAVARACVDIHRFLYYSEVQRSYIMAASRMVQARVPGDIQDMANQVIKASGLTVSDVVRVLMTRIAQDKIIPPGLFQPNTETLAAFAEVERGGLQRFDSVDALFAELHAQD